MTAQANWDLLRKTLQDEIALYKSKSQNVADLWDNRAHDFTLVLDAMDVFEFGYNAWLTKLHADPEFVPVPDVPGLAEHTAAAPSPELQADYNAYAASFASPAGLALTTAR